MTDGHPVALLMFGTLAVAVLLGLFLLVRFLRRPGNRHPMAGQRERTIDEIRRDGPD